MALLSESATSARLALICDEAPLAPVRVRLASSDPALASLSTSEVVFTASDFRVTRFVDVTRAAGGSEPVSVTIRTSNAQSTDPEFARLPVDDVLIDFDPSTSEAPFRPTEPRTPALDPSSGAPSQRR